MATLRAKFLKWKNAFEEKKIKVNLGKTIVMVSGLKEEIFISKVDSCAKWSKRLMSKSVLFRKCGKWVQ